jgi:hypothetical protein
LDAPTGGIAAATIGTDILNRVSYRVQRIRRLPADSERAVPAREQICAVDGCIEQAQRQNPAGAA